MRLIIASNNKNKIDEIRQILGERFSEILSLREAGIELNTVEDADSFLGNARKKALEAAALLPGDVVLADDSGLCVDALDGRPGVYSARYGGLDTDDEQISLLLSELKDVPAEKRTARFVAVFCAVFPDGGTLSARGECEGTILFERRGFDDFGYDPVFYYPPAGKTFAEMTQSEKCAVSHRGSAVRGFAKLFFKE